MLRDRLRAGSATVAVALLGACASAPFAPTGVRPGDSRDAVLRVMGPPTAIHRMADGHERLEYSRMPAGRQTFMVDLDAGARVRGWENVVDETHFAAVVPGMTPDEVRALIGPPAGTGRFARPQPAFTWLYRFISIQRCVLFEVSFDAATAHVSSTEYPPDPECPGEHWR